MCCKWNLAGLAAAAFGVGVLTAALCPLKLLVPLSALILIAAGIALLL